MGGSRMKRMEREGDTELNQGKKTTANAEET